MSSPYILAKRQDLKKYVQDLIDRHIPTIVRNDIKLAKLKVYEGEGVDISPSLIEGAKTRLFDRSSLGPVVRKIDQRSLSVSVDLSDAQREMYMRELIAEARRMNMGDLPQDLRRMLPVPEEGKQDKGGGA